MIAKYKKHLFIPFRMNNSFSMLNNYNACCKYCNITVESLTKNINLTNALSPFVEEINNKNNYDLLWKIVNETIPCLTEEEFVIKNLLE